MVSALKTMSFYRHQCVKLDDLSEAKHVLDAVASNE